MEVFNIPFSDLYLSYAGQILNESMSLRKYFLVNNGVVYALDGRKYVKKIEKKTIYENSTSV